MQRAGGGEMPGDTQVALIDPETMTVAWMNEAAAALAADRGEAAGPGIPVHRVLPMAGALGMPEALREVAETGVARHLRAEVVGMARRSVALVISMYRLPGGQLLLIAEHAVQAGRGRPDGGGPRPPRRPSGGVT